MQMFSIFMDNITFSFATYDCIRLSSFLLIMVISLFSFDCNKKYLKVVS